MDSLDSLQKYSSPYLNSLERFSILEQNPEMGITVSRTENCPSKTGFAFSASSVSQGDLTLRRERFGNPNPAQMLLPQIYRFAF